MERHEMRVASLHIYPVKGMRALDLERAQLAERGLEGDRRWLVVDVAGTFATQRSHSKLATVTAALARGGLRLSAEGAGEVHVERPASDRRVDISIWGTPVNAALADAGACGWISNVLGEDMRLVYMDARAVRMKESVWTSAPVPVSFADGFPVTVVATGSLAAVNADIARHGGTAVPMRRFRPNIVVDCDVAWREDSWRVLRMGGIELELVKPSERCVVTTKDQSTGETMGSESLASLTRVRRSADRRIKGVLFAWNGVPRALGAVAVGDAVEILEERPDGFAIARDQA
jgi:uncharacterized protein YcbX